MELDKMRSLIALSFVPMIGSVTGKNLIAYCGSADAVFKERSGMLMKIPGIGPKLAEAIRSFKDFARVDAEVEFIRKHNIQAISFLEEGYPHRLKEFPDSPLVLYYKGKADLNAPRMLAVVGTRKASEYGKKMCEQIVEELAPFHPIIVSGLAYGIDYIAHKASLKHNIPTVGVVGHGMQMVYPAAHRDIAARMLENGGLLTEYPSGVEPDREHFPARNRIVAGLCDGVLLVETALKGGALITAEIANSYSRDVFALPGRTSDPYSTGCNYFIKLNKANLIESAADIAYLLGWDQKTKSESKPKILSNLSPLEKKIVELLGSQEKMDIDTLSLGMGYTSGELSVLLLEMEFKGIIRALPGKIYRLH